MTRARRRPPLRPLLALFATALIGCAARNLAPPAKVGGGAVQGAETAEAGALIAGLARKAQSLSSLQADAVMEYTQGSRRIKTREQVTIRRPQSLRIEAYYAFGVALVVASDGAQIQVFEPSKNALLYGRANAATLSRFAHVPLAPRPAVNLLMGLAPDAGDSTQPVLSYVRREGTLLIAGFRQVDGSAIELGFAGPELVVTRERERDGALRYQVGYGEYRSIGGISLAHRIEANFPQSSAALKFTYTRAVLNRVFEDSLFVLSPGPATRAIDLDYPAS